MMQLADFEFVQLTQDTDILPFLSEDEDLNNFLIEDAKNYSADLILPTGYTNNQHIAYEKNIYTTLYPTLVVH